MKSTDTNNKTKSGAFWVGLGILLSRIAGLIRERAFAHYFGNSDSGDAFKAALKIPNFLQNLFGEGVLSASFIPVYSKLIAENKQDEATHLANTLFSLLALIVSFLSTIGIILAPYIIQIVAPGFPSEKQQLTITLVQIFFPGTALLVLSAWCLGILNSHKKFFLSYVAPVFWNLIIILGLIIWGRTNNQDSLAQIAAWALVFGSAIQFGVQIPSTLKLIKIFRPNLSFTNDSIKKVLNNFFPVLTTRGVVQFSAYIDNMLASLLPSGSVSAIAYAQTLYLLPISLFGMSVSASELPNMSQALGTQQEVYKTLKERLDNGLKQIAFFIIPSCVAFIFLGDLIIALLFQSGAFDEQATFFVWGILVAYSFGLLASTLGRLYSSTFYALQDTKTPLKFAIIRVLLSTLFGLIVVFKLPDWLNIPQNLSTAALGLSASLVGWIEFYLLRKSLNKIIGHTGLKISYQTKVWLCAILGCLPGLFVKSLQINILLKSILVLGVYGLSFFTFSYLLKVEECRRVVDKLLRKLKIV